MRRASQSAAATTTTMREWCDALAHPCYVHERCDLLSISQPSSTGISLLLCTSYLLSGCAIARRNTRREVCRSYYAAAMGVWATALLFATASYQAYTYQLQCQHREDACIERVDGGEVRTRYAADDNWAAIVYLVLQLVGHHLLVVGDAHRIDRVAPTALACAAITFAFVAFVSTVRLHGVTQLYEVSLLAASPSFACQVWYNCRVAYAPRLLLCWCLLTAAFGVYALLLSVDDASSRWRRTGVWFHANDALHVVLLPYGPMLVWASRTTCDHMNTNGVGHVPGVRLS